MSPPASERSNNETSPPLHAGDAAPNVTLRDFADQSRELASLWRERPLVLLFVRHFG